MKPRSSVRRVMKWLGVVVCFLIMGMFGISLKYRITRGSRYGLDELNLDGGILSYSYGGSPYSAFYKGEAGPRFVIFERWGLTPDEDFLWIRNQNLLYRRLVSIPLWIPIVLVAIPTSMAFIRDRRLPPGHCKECGYDLKGNLSGRCPECGTVCAPITAR